MNETSDARYRLRAATAADHDRVDRAFSAYDLSDPAGYAHFLRAQAEAYLPVEAALDASNAHDILSDWPQRRRADLLRADLVELGQAVPVAATCALFRSREEILGAIYVLEGSRLGGRMLARSVPADQPRRFLGTGAPGLWRKLIEILDTQLVSEAQVELASDAAHRVFALFEAGARRHEGALQLG